VARVWYTVVTASVARTASFQALAIISNWWLSGGKFMEQVLLRVFANCWLLAALYQQEVLASVRQPEVAALAAD